MTSVSTAHATHYATYCTPCRPLMRAFSRQIRTPHPTNLHSIYLADYAKVDMLGSRYRSNNFGAEKSRAWLLRPTYPISFGTCTPRAICTVLLDPRDPSLHSERTQGFAADPDYWKGEVFAYVGRNQNLKELKRVSCLPSPISYVPQSTMVGARRT